MGIGSGNRVTNPRWINSFTTFPIFSPTPISPLLIRQSTLLTIYKFNTSFGYQFNRYVGIGGGVNIDALVQDEMLIGNTIFERTNLNPYFQGKFNYPLPNWGNKNLFLNINAFRHTEIVTGLGFHANHYTWNIGLGWYTSYFAFKTENYFSFQVGFQF